jgi:GGDEF domain-containing protein
MGKERSLEGFIGGIENLPTLPGIAIRILKAVQKKEPDINEISDIISTDPPLSAKVLRLANSSFYNLIQDAYNVAERIRKTIDSLRIKHEDDLIHFTMSFGIASFQTEEKTASDKLIKRADSALYQAKKQGRNQCCIFGEV